MSDWKNIQYKDGKMRTSSGGGGGGASALTDLDDVNVSSPSDGQVLKYDDTADKWVNANESSGGHTYSTSEQRIGTWINGKPIYEIVLQADTKTNAYTSIDVSSLNIDIPLNADVFGRCTLNGTDFTLGSYFQDNNDGINTYLQSNKTTLVVRSKNSYPRGENMYVVLRYTKTTD